jgi:hypothetical protein
LREPERRAPDRCSGNAERRRHDAAVDARYRATTDHAIRDEHTRREDAKRLKAEEQKAANEKHAADVRAEHAKLTHTGRLAALQKACAGDGCDEWFAARIVEAGATNAERAQLGKTLEVLQKAAEARERAKTVCCCDGTVSGCDTPHKGCCSGHRGVCPCQ